MIPATGRTPLRALFLLLVFLGAGLPACSGAEEPKAPPRHGFAPLRVWAGSNDSAWRVLVEPVEVTPHGKPEISTEAEMLRQQLDLGDVVLWRLSVLASPGQDLALEPMRLSCGEERFLSPIPDPEAAWNVQQRLLWNAVADGGRSTLSETSRLALGRFLVTGPSPQDLAPGARMQWQGSGQVVDLEGRLWTEAERTAFLAPEEEEHE